MRIHIQTTLHALIVLLTASLLAASPPRPARPETPVASRPGPSTKGLAASKRLHALFEAQWEAAMQDQPTWASSLGDRRWNDRWADLSPASYARRDAEDAAALKALQAIERAELPPGDQVNRDLFERRLKEGMEERHFRTQLMPLDMRSGIQTENELSDSLRFETVKDYEEWIARLRAFGGHLDQTIALMREGLATGRVQPKIVMQRVPAQIEHQLVDDPAKSPFHHPFDAFPVSIAPEQRSRLKAEGEAAISEVVVPAYRRFQEFFTGTYLPGCRDSIGASELPDGPAFYASRVRQMTTTDLTPDAIHRIGLDEVARIRKEMDALIAKIGFEGTFEDFLTFLRTDPRFFVKDSDELLARYRSTAKRIDPELVRLFGRLPRMPYGVKPIPAEIAPDTTTAYYEEGAPDGSRPGIFRVNVYKPEVRPSWEMMALALHESVPGHHLQISLAQELGDLPKFRRYTGYTAFVEGWGLYSESLGEELGLYDDPYSKFGRLTYEMWRAVRLVVDTGIHALGWTRQQAIDYFAANAPKTQQDIVNEVDRYIGWPGQALAYKIGELKIKELRARATAALGETFDVRAFHDVVLGSGAVPLDVLERNVDTWIASRRASVEARSASR